MSTPTVFVVFIFLKVLVFHLESLTRFHYYNRNVELTNFVWYNGYLNDPKRIALLILFLGQYQKYYYHEATWVGIFPDVFSKIFHNVCYKFWIILCFISLFNNSFIAVDMNFICEVLQRFLSVIVPSLKIFWKFNLILLFNKGHAFISLLFVIYFISSGWMFAK